MELDTIIAIIAVVQKRYTQIDRQINRLRYRRTDRQTNKVLELINRITPAKIIR